MTKKKKRTKKFSRMVKIKGKTYKIRSSGILVPGG